MIFSNFFNKLFSHNQKLQNTVINNTIVYVTFGWDGHPTITKGDGYVLPRKAEMILNKQYYPTGKVGDWPCDPITGEKLPIEPYIKPKN